MKTEKISTSLLKADDIDSWIRFTYLVDPVEFKQSFARIGIRVRHQEDIELLSIAAKNGLDKNGAVKNALGKNIYFDILSICKNMNLSEDELREALVTKKIEIVS